MLAELAYDRVIPGPVKIVRDGVDEFRVSSFQQRVSLFSKHLRIRLLARISRMLTVPLFWLGYFRRQPCFWRSSMILGVSRIIECVRDGVYAKKIEKYSKTFKRLTVL